MVGLYGFATNFIILDGLKQQLKAMKGLNRRESKSLVSEICFPFSGQIAQRELLAEQQRSGIVQP